MKLWFAKMRISAALDTGERPSAKLSQRVSRSPELRGFQQELTTLDRALKQAAPRPEAPAALHRSIMQAVRAAERPVAARREWALLRWAPVPVLAGIVLVALWWGMRNPAGQPTRSTQSLATATAALELGGQIARTAPGAVFAPLTDELARLNRDLDNTAQFLLASVP
ncbi:MAG: hypothetical protein NT154_09515 [Verrucomicrobia bacterium]|nr:hypothetical protein [Verrucomicrobiota bacterium]